MVETLCHFVPISSSTSESSDTESEKTPKLEARFGMLRVVKRACCGGELYDSERDFHAEQASGQHEPGGVGATYPCKTVSRQILTSLAFLKLS
jgi:hypothetical protein